MNSQNNEDDSMNFSMIDRNQQHQGNLDFSVRSLLEDNRENLKNKQQAVILQPATHHFFLKNKQATNNKNIKISGLQTDKDISQNFLKDLSRMEKELSFQTESYNIYEDNPNISTQMVYNNKSKTLSYLKVTKEYTNKSISKEHYHDFNDYYGNLIIDFHKKDIKTKEKIINKADSKNSSNLSSQNSALSKEKNGKNNKNNDIKSFLKLNQKKSNSKTKTLASDFKKSKSKSLTLKIKQKPSKNKSNLKVSTETETFEQKVFSQYYGTEASLRPKRQDVKKKKDLLESLRSRQKSSKSKISVLSPRGKQIKKVQFKK